MPMTLNFQSPNLQFHRTKKNAPKNIWYVKRIDGGKRGIRTLAPVSRPTALAGPPLRPLEYLPMSTDF